MEIELTNVTKRFGSTTAVDNVSIQLSGRINLLLGSNGSGKTTLINLLAGLAYPNRGILRLNGSEYDGRNRKAWRNGTETLRKKSRFWLDKSGLPQPLTGRELLLFELNKEREDLHSFKGLVESSFGSSVDLDKPISTYSSGMQQKLGLMATLIGNPEFVVWDEPTASLDATSRSVVARLAKDFASQGTKFLIASHIPGDFEGVADWVGLMRLGQLLKCGNLSDLSNDSIEYAIATDKPLPIAGRLLELGMARSVSVDDGSIAVKATGEFNEAKVALLSKEYGATQLTIRRRQKSITELYMEAL